MPIAVSTAPASAPTPGASAVKGSVSGPPAGVSVQDWANYLTAMSSMPNSVIQGAAAYQGDPLAVVTANGGIGDAAPGNPNNPITAGMPPPAVQATASAPPSAAPTPSGATAPAAAPQAGLSDYLNALVGSAPTAPQTSDFGPAPTVGDFFSATPYQQALQAVGQGNTAAQGTIGNAYGQAASNLAQEQAVGNSQAAGFGNQANADMGNTAAQIASIVANANKLAGGNAGLGGLQGSMALQQGSERNMLDNLNQLRTINNSGFTQALTSNKQGALDALASAVSGENNKINFAEAADQAKAQQMVASANSARGTAMAKANTDYQNALKSYNAQKDSLLKVAASEAAANAPSNRQAALGALANWQSGGHQGLYGVANGIVNGTTNSTGTKIPAAKNLAEAQNYLGTMYQSGAFGPDAYNALNGWLNQYYSTGKTAPDVMGALAQMAGAQ